MKAHRTPKALPEISTRKKMPPTPTGRQQIKDQSLKCTWARTRVGNHLLALRLPSCLLSDSVSLPTESPETAAASQRDFALHLAAVCSVGFDPDAEFCNFHVRRSVRLCPLVSSSGWRDRRRAARRSSASARITAQSRHGGHTAALLGT